LKEAGGPNPNSSTQKGTQACKQPTKKETHTKDSLKLTLFQRKEDLEWDEKTFSGKFALMNLATMRA
jgi:hypothetical protein